MNCSEFRRLLLADPRASTPERLEHAAGCAACAQLAREVEPFETSLHEAMRVPVPEALVDRVLSRRIPRAPTLQLWALAASLVAALGIGIALYRGAANDPEPVLAASTLGASHPAVAAIDYVVAYEQKLLDAGHRGDPAVTRQVLDQLGLRLPAGGVTVRYLGKCPVPPGANGEHVVLQTRSTHASLILVPGQRFASRVLVAGHSRTAVASPSRSGSYILITDSPESLRQVEKLLM